MPIPSVLVLLALAGSSPAAPALAHLPPRPAAHAQRPFVDAALRAELRAMEAQDQAIRARWIAAGVGDLAWAARTRALDRRQTARLKAIIRRHGWPTAARVGQDGVRAAFLLVQHADHDLAFQRACLPQVQAAAARGELTGQAVAR